MFPPYFSGDFFVFLNERKGYTDGLSRFCKVIYLIHWLNDDLNLVELMYKIAVSFNPLRKPGLRW